MPKIAYVTNIPTPYRDFRFKRLSDLLKGINGTLKVHYMGKTELGRNWDLQDMCQGYDFKIHKNLGFSFGKVDNVYFNPSLLFDLWKDNYDIIIVGGISSPTHFLSGLLPYKAMKIISIESNLDSIRFDNFFINTYKKLILNRFDKYQVTGVRSIKYLEKYLSRRLENSEVITLPNLINENDFDFDSNRKIKVKLLVSNNKINVFCAARLEQIKGVKDWLIALAHSEVDNFHFFIAGDGSQKEEIEKIIQLNALPVTLLGHVNSDSIKEWYKICDLFLLPSWNDPSPLSCIEALYLKKPLLISNRVGNVNEVLEEGVNGYSFDISNKNEISNLMIKVSKLDKENLSNMGASSGRLYEERFQPNPQLKNYIDRLICNDKF